MNFRTHKFIILSLLLLTAIPGFAAELTAESLAGKWLYTHILMEEGREIPVNFPTTFEPNGTVVYFSPTGAEFSRGTFEISEGSILYEDEKGPQEWKVIAYDGDSLHVDHRGAAMFFERQ